MKAFDLPDRLKAGSRSDQGTDREPRRLAVSQLLENSAPKLSSLDDERTKRTLWLHSPPTAFTIGIVVFVGVIFAILLQLDRERWETERDGAKYGGFRAISQRGPVSMLIESLGPTPSISPILRSRTRRTWQRIF